VFSLFNTIAMKKILLIEDNSDIRSNTAEILELANYKVIQAENGKTGVELAIAHKPDLIVCDIMMPELDGYGVLHAVHKNKAIKNTPFIFLTAKSDRSDFRKGMEQGADDYITKPFDGIELLNAVDSRLKKIDLLKQELLPGPDSTRHLLLASCRQYDLQKFVEGRNTNTYKKKQIIYSESNHPNRLYYVVKGKVKTYKTNDDGKAFVTGLFSAGDFLGYTALLEDAVYRDTAEALEETELAVIPREDFMELINSNKEATQKFISLLAGNVAARENQLINLAYNSLRRKVADALLLLQEKYHNKKEENFSINISRESLAAIAGTATESLVRTLSEFRIEGLIDIKDGYIIILNRGKLQALVN
jgi:DNA-binding response OmpR family regulator